MKWYLIHTKPKQEFRAQENLNLQGYTTFLPTLKVQKLKKNAVEVQEDPLFHRYLFIQLDQLQSNWFPIRSTIGVHQMVRFGMSAKPVIVPDQLVEDLRARDPDQFLVKDLFEPGEPVQIKDGPFKNVQGDFLQLLKDSTGESRALLLIDILGKTQQIKVVTSNLQKIS
jgi:transcriptional antiterminator RfaH